MNDFDIRPALLKTLTDKNSESDGSVIVEEMGVCQGDARIDVAVINGSIHGYEIKSPKDTLKRLSAQSSYYNLIFDHVTLVVGSNHLQKAMEQIPEWWGVCEVVNARRGDVLFKTLRRGRKNREVDALSVAQLLWREEALEILASYNLDKGMRSKSRQKIWEHLSAQLPLKYLQHEVRQTLKTRSGWLPEKQQTQYAD